MAKTYEGLQRQHRKITTALEGLAPPQPDDEYEDLRREVLKSSERVHDYLQGRVTGEGSLSTPEARQPGE